MARIGRPPKKLPPGALDVIREAAAKGVAETKLAKLLRMDFATWRRIREEDPAAKKVWEEAKAIERDVLAGRLFSVAMDDEHPQAVTAAIFLLKARHGYRDQGPADTAADGPKVNLVFNLPAPLSGDQYRRLVEIHPEALPSPGSQEAA